MSFIKFITTVADEIFTAKGDENHEVIAYNNYLDIDDVTGGGFIDHDKKMVTGESQKFGKYDGDTVTEHYPDYSQH